MLDIGYSDPLRFRLLNRSDLREITAKKWGMSWQRKRASSAATDWEALNRQSRGAGALGTGGAGYDASSDQVTRAATLAGLLVLAVPVVAWLNVTRLLAYRLPTDNYATQFQNPAVMALAARKHDQPFRVATAGARMATIMSASGTHFYPAFAFAYGLETVDGYYRLHSARYHRFFLRIIAGLIAANPDIAHRVIKWPYLFAPPGYERDRNRPIRVAAYYNLDLLSLANVRYLIANYPLEDSRMQLIYHPRQERAEQASWSASRVRHRILKILAGQAPPHALLVYENPQALPRAFLVGNMRYFEDRDALLQYLEQTPLPHLRKTVPVKTGEAPPSGTPLGFSQGRATVEQYTPDRLTLTTVANGPAILVVTNNYDPFWQVHIDGAKASLFPVYHTFQGVLLAAGRHTVALEYRPPYAVKRGGW